MRSGQGCALAKPGDGVRRVREEWTTKWRMFINNFFFWKLELTITNRTYLQRSDPRRSWTGSKARRSYASSIRRSVYEMVDNVATRLAEERRSLDRHACPFPRYSGGRNLAGIEERGYGGNLCHRYGTLLVDQGSTNWTQPQGLVQCGWHFIGTRTHESNSGFSYSSPKKRACDEGKCAKAESQQRKRSV